MASHLDQYTQHKPQDLLYLASSPNQQQNKTEKKRKKTHNNQQKNVSGPGRRVPLHLSHTTERIPRRLRHFSFCFVHFYYLQADENKSILLQRNGTGPSAGCDVTRTTRATLIWVQGCCCCCSALKTNSYSRGDIICFKCKQHFALLLFITAAVVVHMRTLLESILHHPREESGWWWGVFTSLPLLLDAVLGCVSRFNYWFGRRQRRRERVRRRVKVHMARKQ